MRKSKRFGMVDLLCDSNYYVTPHQQNMMQKTVTEFCYFHVTRF